MKPENCCAQGHTIFTPIVSALLLRITFIVLALAGQGLYLNASAQACCGATCGGNMVINGTFTAPCFTGYASDVPLFPCAPPPALGGPNQGTEGTNAAVHNAAWAGGEHTGIPGSRMLLINGPVPFQGPKRAWFQTVNVEAGKEYCFSTWLMNPCIGCIPLPIIELRTGGLFGPVLASVPVANNGIWIQVCGIYKAAVTGPIEIDITIQAIGGGAGNDIAIDDISFMRKPLDPGFTASSMTVNCGEVIDFTSNDQAASTNHSWVFGDGNSSTLANPSHTYTSAGTYMVLHKADDGCSSGVDTLYITVNCCTTPDASFGTSPAQIGCGTTATFTNNDHTPGLTHTWYINGVQMSTDSTFTYTFNGCGAFYVDHTVNHPCGSSATATYMVLIEAPDGSFSYPGNTPTCGQTVTFTAANQAAGLTHSWKVNGATVPGTTSMTYTFATAGTYVVEHTVSNACCTTVVTSVFTVGCSGCNCSICGPNLVTNGDFSGPCNWAYSSDLTYVPCFGSTYLGQSAYSESNNAQYYSTAWDGLDHTPGGGTRFMIIDGPDVQHGAKRAWYQNVNVQAGKTYCFSAWVKNACIVCGPDPILELRIGGLNGTLIVSDTPARGSGPNGWTKMCGTFTATATQTIELDVTIPSLSYAGNDALLDDIEFGEACGSGGSGTKSRPVAQSVYPNPVSKGEMLYTMYQADSDGTIRIQITNMEGRKVMEKTLQVKEGNNLIDFSTGSLLPGMYLISVTGGGEPYFGKFIVK